MLSSNVRRRVAALARNPDVPVTAWLIARGISNGNVTRILSGTTSVGLDLLAQLARALRLAPYQLLVPELDPENPVRLPATHDELRLYRVLAMALANEEAIRGESREVPPMDPAGKPAGGAVDRPMPGTRPSGRPARRIR